jgi:putative endonuclease
MADKDVLGRAGEDRAAQHLTALGYTVLSRNWRAPGGELDVVAAHGREIVVVEVKTRRSLGFGHPLEAVDDRKRRRLWRLAMAWAAAHPEHARGRAIRLDAIAIVGPHPATGTLEHLEDLR